MKTMAEKILSAIWALIKSIAIIVIVIFALIYVMDLNASGDPALVTKDTSVYSDPGAEITRDEFIGACTVVEAIGEPNSYGYTKIRFDSNLIGYVPSSNLLDISTLINTETPDKTHVVKVESDILGFDDLSADEATIRIIRELNSYYEEHLFSGVYVEVEKSDPYSTLVQTLEALQIPYGYFIHCEEFEDIPEINEFISQNLVDVESSYNILPITLDLTGSDFYSYELNDSFEEAAFYGVHSGDNYWTIFSQESESALEFVSSRNYAIEVTGDDDEEYISLVRLNSESSLYERFLENYNTLFE